MRQIKRFIRKLIPEEIISWWHWLQTIFAAIILGFPAKKMVVIGITGSKGKTTTSNMVWAALSANGYMVGQTGTANLRIGNVAEPNKYHMTMLGRWHLQKYLKRMLNAGCKYVVIETPSEGQKQYRHAGINYDILLFTNLTDERLAIHGNSTDILKKDNARVFRKLAHYSHKSIDQKVIPKIIITNADAVDSTYYADFNADKHVSFGVKNHADYKVKSLSSGPEGTEFELNEIMYKLPILGEFNVINAAGAIAVASELGVSADKIKAGLEKLTVIPGRMEVIDEGQDFMLIVDYAHEQTGMELLLKSAAKMRRSDHNKIIVHLGAEGGGRDKRKRSQMGEIAARLADIVIIGNVDPYDDEPMEIINEIAAGTKGSDKVVDKNLFLLEDRRAGIAKALKLAKKGDVVLITGKGAEQSMIIKGKDIEWDDRVVVRELVKKIVASHG